MTKKKISLLVLLAIMLLLSSCDVTTLLNNFKGNAYEEVFNIDLVGEQAQEAADSVVEALAPVVEGGRSTLPEQTKEQKEGLKSTVAKSLSGSSKDAFVKELQEAANQDQKDAAQNTIDDIDDKLDDLNNLANLDQEVQDKIDEFIDGLSLDLPPNPTQADILNVQMASNLVGSLSSVLDLVDNDGDEDDIIEGLLEVVSDATFMVNVSRAQGSTSDLINSIDIAGLIGMFGDDDGSSSDIEERYSINSETVDYLNGFKATINLVLEDILGVDTEAAVPTMDEDKFKAAITNSKLEYSGYKAFITAAKAGNYTYDTLGANQRALFGGVSGLINYTISTVLVNVDGASQTLATNINDTDYDTIKEIVDVLLASNTDLVGVDEYDTDMEFVLPSEIEELGNSFDNPEDILSDLNLDVKAETFIDDAILLYTLGVKNTENDPILEMLNEVQASFED